MGMLEEYEESFYYDKPSSVGTEAAGQAVGAGIGLGDGLIGIVLSGLIFLISRIDLFSSALLGVLFFMLTYKNEWSVPVYLIAELVIIVGSMLLQHKFKIARIIYMIFTCVAAAFMGPIFIGVDSGMRLNITMAVSFGIAALWGFLSWRFVINP